MKNQNLIKFKEGFAALLFLLLFLLCGCSEKVYTPEIKNEFEARAVCTFGDFSYNCKIVKTADAVFVTPLDTRAAGMTIKCNGDSVSFTKGSMVREFKTQTIDATNPAVVLYEALNSLDTLTASVNESGITFTGNVSAGEYSFLFSTAGEPKILTVNSAGICFDFLPVD